MVHQYESDEKRTGLEKKYERFNDNYFDKKEALRVASNLVNPSEDIPADRKTLGEKVNPNQKFVQTFTERIHEQENQLAKERQFEKYNEKGEEMARPYLKAEFHQVHDPLGIYAKKANYEELAWKVFRETKDEEIYLKALYYPRLSKKDYNLLVDRFIMESKQVDTKNKFAYFSSIGVFAGAWVAAYRYSFKLPTFFLATIGGSFISCWAVQKYYSRKMNNTLNVFARDVAGHYPDIKFSTVQYVKNN